MVYAGRFFDEKKGEKKGIEKIWYDLDCFFAII